MRETKRSNLYLRDCFGRASLAKTLLICYQRLRVRAFVAIKRLCHRWVTKRSHLYHGDCFGRAFLAKTLRGSGTRCVYAAYRLSLRLVQAFATQRIEGLYTAYKPSVQASTNRVYRAVHTEYTRQKIKKKTGKVDLLHRKGLA